MAADTLPPAVAATKVVPFHEFVLEPPAELEFTVEAHEDDDDDVLEPAAEEGRPAWERQAGESYKAYHAFCHYRDLGAKRSVRVAYINHKGHCDHQVVNPSYPPKRWQVWSSMWGWPERASLWDAELDRQLREKLAADQLEARQRHARASQATLSALLVPVRGMLSGIQKHPEMITKLEDHMAIGPGATLQGLAAVIRAAQVIPGIINAERLALGLTTESVEIEDKRDVDVVAQRIVEDPDATRMAIALLDRTANPREGAAERPGVPGEPAEVASDAPPEPPDGETGSA